MTTAEMTELIQSLNKINKVPVLRHKKAAVVAKYNKQHKEMKIERLVEQLKYLRIKLQLDSRLRELTMDTLKRKAEPLKIYSSYKLPKWTPTHIKSSPRRYSPFPTRTIPAKVPVAKIR